MSLRSAPRDVSEQIGGWRHWVRDANGNQFYYAHLAAYSRLALHASRVHAGEVIGFVGRTGDAFTTAPHLHFEIHPRPLLHLHYDGAVDPTSYLQAWPHETPTHVPAPVRLRAPPGLPRLEAAVVWSQLLLARGIAPVPRKPARPPGLLLPDLHGRLLEQATAVSAPADPRPGRRHGLVLPLLLALAAAAAGGGLAIQRRRSRQTLPKPSKVQPRNHARFQQLLAACARSSRPAGRQCRRAITLAKEAPRTSVKITSHWTRASPRRRKSGSMAADLPSSTPPVTD